MGKAKALIALVAVVAVAAACFTAMRARKGLTPTEGQGNLLAHKGAATPDQPSAISSNGPPGPPAPQATRDGAREMADSAAPGDGRHALAPSEFTAALDDADRLIAAGQSVASHRILSALYRARDCSDAQTAQLLRRLESTARNVFFSPGDPSLEAPYVLQTGELLMQVARKWRVSWQYLERLNGIDARRIRVGQRLKVVRGPFDAVVDLSDFELTVYLNGLWVRHYPVGTGRTDSRTPVGTFTVLDKVENPKYDGPEGHFTPDDPNNPVGEHWIALGGGYGIHGTVEPESIGKEESLGCIRMFPDHVEEVYHLLVRGSRVTIRR